MDTRIVDKGVPLETAQKDVYFQWGTLHWINSCKQMSITPSDVSSLYKRAGHGRIVKVILFARWWSVDPIEECWRLHGNSTEPGVTTPRTRDVVCTSITHNRNYAAIQENIFFQKNKKGIFELPPKHLPPFICPWERTAEPLVAGLHTSQQSQVSMLHCMHHLVGIH